MGGVQSTVTKVNTEVRNEFLNRMENECKADCSQSQIGNIIVVDGSVGNISIEQKCKATSSCVIKNSLDSSVDTIIQSVIDSEQDYQDSVFSIGWNFQRTLTENSTLLENKITNIMSSSCNSDVSQLQSDSIIYVKGSAESIALTQEGSSISNCTIDNMAKMVAYNEIASDIQNRQGRTSGFGAMMAAIISLIVFAIIMFIMMIMFTGVIGIVKGGDEGDTGTSSKTTDVKVVKAGSPQASVAASAAATVASK